MKKLVIQMQLETLRIGTWVMNYLKRFDYSDDVPVESFLEELTAEVKRSQENRQDLVNVFSSMTHRDRFFGCCTLNRVIQSVAGMQHCSDEDKAVQTRIAEAAIVAIAYFMKELVGKRKLEWFEMLFLKCFLSASHDFKARFETAQLPDATLALLEKTMPPSN